MSPIWAPREPQNRPKSAFEMGGGSPVFGFYVGRPWKTDFGPILGPSWGHLGAILGPSWAILAHLGRIWDPSWAILGSSWAILGPSWSYLGPILGFLEPCCAHPGPQCSSVRFFPESENNSLMCSWSFGLFLKSWAMLSLSLGLFPQSPSEPGFLGVSQRRLLSLSFSLAFVVALALL